MHDSGVERRLPLDGAMNVRDLGGYLVAGGTVRWGVAYRADALVNLSERDLSQLVDVRGIRTVVDLRRDREIESEPSAFAQHRSVRYCHAPVVLDEGGIDSPAQYLGTLDFAAYYLDMILLSPRSFALLFRLLAEGAHPLVFHCAGGRDRTGVAAALLLLAAGVSREQILADYLLSNDLLVRRVERWRAVFMEEGVDPAPILENMRLRPRYLAPTLDVIEGQFGGIDGYLKSIGVSRAELAEVRRILIDCNVGCAKQR